MAKKEQIKCGDFPDCPKNVLEIINTKYKSWNDEVTAITNLEASNQGCKTCPYNLRNQFKVARERRERLEREKERRQK